MSTIEDTDIPPETRAEPARVIGEFDTLDLPDTKNVFLELDNCLCELAGQVICTLDCIIPHLAAMQALLSQRGKARKTVLKQAGLPSWPEYASNYGKRLNRSLRTIQDHITGFYRNGKSGSAQSVKNGQKPKQNDSRKPSKPWHADAKDPHALAGAQLAINDLITAYEAGADLAPAYEQYKKVAVSPTKLSDIVESAKPESDKANTDAEVKKKLVPVVETAERYIRALEALVYSVATEEEKKTLQKPKEDWRSILRYARGVKAEQTGKGVAVVDAPVVLKEAA